MFYDFSSWAAEVNLRPINGTEANERRIKQSWKIRKLEKLLNTA